MRLRATDKTHVSAMTGKTIAYKPIGWSGNPWPQYLDEIEAFADLLNAEGVRSYLEVGCRYGDTVHFVGTSLPSGARIVATDFPAHKNGRRSPRHTDSATHLQRAVEDLSANGRPATMILGDSHAADTVAKVRALAPFDAVLIDGDHTYEGVAADWRNFGPMGRLVAFHDLMGDKSASIGPRRLFNELKQSYRHQVISCDAGSRGIGVIWRT